VLAQCGIFKCYRTENVASTYMSMLCRVTFAVYLKDRMQYTRMYLAGRRKVFKCLSSWCNSYHCIFIIIIIFLRGLGRLSCSGIDALPSFPGASTISSPSRFVVEGVFRQSGVVRSFEMVDPVLFVFGFQVLYCRDL
jgi:hypothetical protein